MMTKPNDNKLNFGELSADTALVTKCENLKESMDQVHSTLNSLLELRNKGEFSATDKIEFDIFTAFLTNSLYYVYLRTQGVDTSNHPIMHELQRVKQVMKRWKDVKDKKNRPVLNKQAAERFIRSGLWDPNNATPPPNKKKKFDNDE